VASVASLTLKQSIVPTAKHFGVKTRAPDDRGADLVVQELLANTLAQPGGSSAE
jgi:hypothetical protein